MLKRVTVVLAFGAFAAFPAGAGEHAKHAKHDKHWSYEATAEGPEHWGSLNRDNAACSIGANQSPIDLIASIPAELPPLQFHYDGQVAETLNNGHALEIRLNGKNELVSRGKSYTLLQAHFHAPSEHTLGGKTFPAEVHFVHKAADGELAVVGFFIQAGSENAGIQPILKELPAAGGKSITLTEKPAVHALLSSTHEYFRYVGSLTTPPCTEGVQWHVMETPIQLDQKQLAALTSLFKGHTARPVQPLKSRFLLHGH